MQVEHKVLPCEFKAVEDNGSFSGYGSVFDNVDFGLDVVAKGAFTETLQQHKAAGTMPAMLWSHDMRLPIGDYESMMEDDHGLVVNGVLWVEGNKNGAASMTESERARNMARGTGPKGLSIGYIVKDASFEEREGKNIRVIKQVELLEVSPVVFAMNPKASITSAKSLDFSNIRDVEHALQCAGLSKSQSKALLADGFKGLRCDDADPQRDAEVNDILASLHSQTHTLKRNLNV